MAELRGLRDHRLFEINVKDELLRGRVSQDGGFTWSPAQTWAAAPLLGGESFNPTQLRRYRKRHTLPQLEAVLGTQVRVLEPAPDDLNRVQAAADATGDARRLSPTDKDLLALALGLGATLVTDDYSIQNLCRALSIPYEPILTPGIREAWTWTYRCTGCGRTWPEWHDECPTCGSPLKTARPRVTRGTR